MKSIYWSVLAFCITCGSSVVMAMQYVPKGDCWLHTQPNGTTTFMATRWGHSFLDEYETDDGYTIVKSGDDNYWYYATLDEEGEYAPSSYKVGIDTPPIEAFHLR